MPITFSCSCGREITVKDEFAGKKGKCPACGNVVEVPAAEAPVAKTEEVYEARLSAATSRRADEPAKEEESTETKACMHCRKQIPANAVFCVHCGTNLRTGQKSAQDHGGVEGDYDYVKAFPDLLQKPSTTIDTIMQATPSTSNFQKSMAFLAIASAILGWTLYQYNSRCSTEFNAGLWFAAVPFALALVATITTGIVAGIGGATFGSSGLPFVNTFMAVIAARTVVGLAMLVPLIVVYSAPSLSWLVRGLEIAVRVGVGGGLTYLIVLRGHETPPPPALVFAGISVLVEGILFWLGGFILGWIMHMPVTLF